jgi:translation elongation factor EF-1alpha
LTCLNYFQALLHYFDKATGRKSKKPPQFAKKGQKIVALIETAEPVCVERFTDYPQLGRFTLRDEGRTIAIGKVRFQPSEPRLLAKNYSLSRSRN